jgi:uncharacterized protein YbcV (DUF1398 family)
LKYPADFTEELKKKPICGVLSVAMVADVSFKQATHAIAKNLMPHQKRHGGKTYHEQRCNALKDLGVHYKEIPVNARMTLARAIGYYCQPGKTYMITTSSHVVTVKDSRVADQVEIASIKLHASRRCIARNILEIVQ